MFTADLTKREQTMTSIYTYVTAILDLHKNTLTASNIYYKVTLNNAKNSLL